MDSLYCVFGGTKAAALVSNPLPSVVSDTIGTDGWSLPRTWTFAWWIASRCASVRSTCLPLALNCIGLPILIRCRCDRSSGIVGEKPPGGPSLGPGGKHPRLLFDQDQDGGAGADREHNEQIDP